VDEDAQGTPAEKEEPRRAGGEPTLVHTLVDEVPAMLAYWGADLRCRFANRAYETWFGVTAEAMVGRDIKEFLGPLYELNLPYIRGVLAGEGQQFEREIPDPAGGPPRYSQAHYIPDLVDGRVAGFCVLVADITRRINAEGALRQARDRLQAAERFASMTTLAAGIAHEINNPLAAVLANVGLLLESRGRFQPTALRTALLDIREAARRIADLVGSMKLLARGGAARHELVDINDTLQRSIALARNAIRYRARLVRDLREIPPVAADASELAQVFVNLLINAAHALAEGPGNDNEIRVSSRSEGDRVLIEVADSGRGIPAGVQSQIFDPFFTTTSVGGGVGLGLSISKRMVEGFGGEISVKSEEGRGAVFQVRLPAAPPRRDRPAPAPSLTAPWAPPAVARPRLLVVDDEPALTRVMERILRRDHDVVAVNTGRDAVALLTSPGDAAFDLVLCDVMMPEVTGEEVYSEVCRQRPELGGRFLFMTGGAFTPHSRRFLDSLSVPVVDKPFDATALRALIATRLRELHRGPGV
jgi:PAS domain S-box-containing protein